VSEDWRGVSNAILYTLIYKSLEDSEADRVANGLVTEPLWSLTPEQEYDALVQALGSDADLGSDIPTPHSDAQYRDFLKRVIDRLDAARPWPELPFQELDPERWPDFARTEPIARIDRSSPYVEDLFHRSFSGLPADEGRAGLIVRLKSGVEVAFVVPWWPDSRNVAVFRNDPQIPPQQVLDELRDVVGLDPETVTLLGA
jgi:hypothetical protein